MALTLIRHTTPDVAQGTCYGRTDLNVADSFDQEAAQVRMCKPTGGVIVSSPLRRCRALAENLSSHLKLEVHVSNHWIEMDFGSWEGVPWDNIPRDQLDGWAEDFMSYGAHGGESVAMLEARINTALSGTPDNAIVVTHSGCIRAACAIRGLCDGWDTDTPFGGMVSLP